MFGDFPFLNETGMDMADPGMFGSMMGGLGLANPMMMLGGGMSALSQVGNLWMNYNNYRNQQRQQMYDRNLQQVMFAREDTAVQRRVADLKAAGLSPVLAAGSAANAGPVVQTHPAQMAPMPDMSAPVKLAMDLMTQKTNIDQSITQQKLMDQQIEKSEVDTDLARIDQVKRLEEIKKVIAEKNQIDVNTSDALNELMKRQQLGTPKDLGPVGKEVIGIGSFLTKFGSDIEAKLRGKSDYKSNKYFQPFGNYKK